MEKGRDHLNGYNGADVSPAYKVSPSHSPPLTANTIIWLLLVAQGFFYFQIYRQKLVNFQLKVSSGRYKWYLINIIILLKSSRLVTVTTWNVKVESL